MPELKVPDAFWSVAETEVLQGLAATPQGLTSAEAAQRITGRGGWGTKSAAALVRSLNSQLSTINPIAARAGLPRRAGHATLGACQTQ